MIGLKIEGRSTFLDLVIAGKELDQTLRNTVKETATQFQGQLRRALSGAGNGKMYGEHKARVYSSVRKRETIFGKKRSYNAQVSFVGRSIAYRASAPGQNPAKRTGNLARAASFEVFSRGYGARVFAEKNIAFYRHFLEFGTAERFVRDYSKDQRVAGKRGRTKLLKGKGAKSVGRVLPRPVLPALQAQLNAEIERRCLRAFELFAAFGGK